MSRSLKMATTAIPTMMYVVGGETSILANRLCKVAQEAMYRGMQVVKPGATIGDIGHAIQKYVESERFSVVREYCGHGIGTTFHDEPQSAALWPARYRHDFRRRHDLYH